MQRLIRHPFVKFAGWWLLWSCIGAWLIHHFGFGWSTAFMDAAITQADFTLAGYAMNLILRYYRPTAKNIINVVILSLALAALFTFVLLPWALPQLISLEAGYSQWIDKSLPLRFLISWMQILFIAVITWLWYFMQDQQMHQQQTTDAEKLVKEAELTQLRQQLQPHFLFNSLNSINALVGTQPQQARHMVQQLSDFLRGTIKKDDRQLVSLEEELNHLQLYLDIEKVRFGYRLKTELQADDDTKKLVLPPLLLQPIVENAIKFGLYDTVGEITIAIRAVKKERMLVVEVTNPFDPATSMPKGTGFGLPSITRRLYLIYSQKDLLTTAATTSTFTTTIMIPQV